MGPLEAFDTLIGRYVGAVRCPDPLCRVCLENRAMTDLVRTALRHVSNAPPEIYIEMPQHTHLPIPDPLPPVHIRRFGSTLCGIHTDPRDWPKGEEWVPFLDASNATCPACMEAFTKV